MTAKVVQVVQAGQIDRLLPFSTVDVKYRSIVRNCSLQAAGVGVPGAFVFGLDVAPMVAIWLRMGLQIAEVSGHPKDAGYMKTLVTAAGAGVGAYFLGSKILMGALNVVPVVGVVGAIALNSALNGFATYKLGQFVSESFENGTFDSLTGNELAARVAAELKVFVKDKFGYSLPEAHVIVEQNDPSTPFERPE